MRHPSKKTWRVAGIVGILAVAGIVVLRLTLPNDAPKILAYTDLENTIADTQEPELLFGIPADSLALESHMIASGSSFGKIMMEKGLGASEIARLLENSKAIFDVRKILAGKPHHFLKTNDTGRATHWIYEEKLESFLVFELKEPYEVRREFRPLDVRLREVAGILQSSLYETIQQLEVSPALAVELAEIYAWTIDFFKVQKGDAFKVIFEERWVDDTVFAGVGAILASNFTHGGHEFDAFRFVKSDGNWEYFSSEGRSLKKAFLKAPLKFFRISSRYNPKRFHPVLKTMKAHLGTDYAAPAGTPIMSTADGVVEKSGYTSGNGNYVKVKHNSVYATQYLHMSRIAPGMKPGRRVRQGEVIGYVGSTGLATGPHVCYRFWKNGVQVDPLREKLPESEEIAQEDRVRFDAFITPFKTKLSVIPYPEATFPENGELL
jgi:murein DD-endopeptidase MepM/ murein hydrolase activator NlpD